MIVCLCQAVSDSQIEEAINRGASSVEAVGRVCGAGTDCGSCVQSIVERLAGAQGRVGGSRATDGGCRKAGAPAHTLVNP